MNSFLLFCLLAVSGIHGVASNKEDKLSIFEYKQPICKMEQSCSYNAFGHHIEVCSCSEHTKCGSKPGVVTHGVGYKFCGDYKPVACKPDDISHVIEGIQISIFCSCPEHAQLNREELNTADDIGFRCIFKSDHYKYIPKSEQDEREIFLKHATILGNTVLHKKAQAPRVHTQNEYKPNHLNRAYHPKQSASI